MYAKTRRRTNLPGDSWCKHVYLFVCVLFVVWDKAEVLLARLHTACSRQLLADVDLIMDAALLLWSTSQPIFSSITSHDLAVCKPLLTHPLATKVKSRDIQLPWQCASLGG